MKKKITLAVLIAVVALGLTACTNTEVSSVGTTTTPVTTPVVTTVNTTTTEATTTSEQLTTEPSSDVVTSEEQTEAVVSDETTTTTSEQEEVTTTTSEQLGSTTTSKKSTTTVGTTTTKKPTTVTTTKATTTTTKKATTTTTKKKTTTTTTAKKQEITTTTSPVIKITQSDVDKLVNELQEYSNSLDVVSQSEYTTYRSYGIKYNTYEEYCDYMASIKTPSNSSWHTVIGWSEYQDPQYEYSFRLYDDMLTYIKEWLDYEYSILPNSHQVVYAEYTTNSHTGATKWDIYLLY
ncbi:MAG: hypothetical protein IJ031_04715 [Oscillospiraceae bacterium]|nr:hypothetical protein [Oscillospiraceae bacterium]